MASLACGGKRFLLSTHPLGKGAAAAGEAQNPHTVRYCRSQRYLPWVACVAIAPRYTLCWTVLLVAALLPREERRVGQ